MIDTAALISIFAKIFMGLIPLIVVILFCKTPFFKGLVGEFAVNMMARLLLNKKEYRLIKNVTLPTEDGTTQIDHVIVSVYGVFVVETKNMKGWIFGGEHQKTWTRKIYKHTQKFQNPLRQNHKHVQTLKKLLELQDDQVHSLVVFVGGNKFKTDLPENVTKGPGYIKFIKSRKQPVLGPGQVDEIIETIDSGRLARSFKTHREHVKHVKEIVNEKQNAVKCPKCGSDMILREAKKGPNQGRQFWGCSRFPKCRAAVKAV